MYFSVGNSLVRQQTVGCFLETYDAAPKRFGHTMTNFDESISDATSIITPQFRNRRAAELYEKAIRHHRQAARLFDAGDEQQAKTHANIAHRHALSALEAACH